MAQKEVLSTQGYRGTRDFYPDEERVRRIVYQKIHSCLQSFGYEAYNGPLLEHFELYASKTSEEIVNEQLYSLIDRGERKLAIRPEMTPTLARMVAAKAAELPRPIRWYSIPTCMRYERPQRGRLREFDQLNVDVLGGIGIDEDVEIVLTAASLLTTFNATEKDFIVQINHRGVMNDFLYERLKIDNTLKSPLLRLLDKRDKMDADKFSEELKKLSLQDGQIKSIQDFLSCDVSSADKFLSGSEAWEELKARLLILEKLLPTNCVRFTPSVMRGFDYYTGLVFEVYDTDPKNRRALYGGGRYDDLVSSFGGEKLSGIGYGVGDVGLINFLTTHNLLPDNKKQVDVAVLRFSEEDRLTSLELAQTLRNMGLSVLNPLTAAKFGKQIQSAEKQNAKAIAFRGEDEIKNNTVCIKWLSSGTQESVPLEQIATLKNKFR